MALGAALAAAAALVMSPLPARTAAPPEARTAAAAWPAAQRADIPARLTDGSAYQPVAFLDARTSIGTATSPDGTAVRLVLRNPDGSVRQLRRLPKNDNPSFSAVTVAGDDVAWTETTDSTRFHLWAVNLRDGAPARQVSTDTGNALLYGSQYDLVIADGRLHWAAAAPPEEQATEIRSVPLTGGRVNVRTEPGSWALSAWPWLADGVSDPAGTSRLRNMATHHDTRVASSSVQTATCSPVWCRVVTPADDGTSRIDLMHPDGSARRRVGGATATSALVDVAPLDRFEVLAEPGPNADLTGTAALRIYDIVTTRTIDVSPDVGNVAYGNGVLWWSTGLRDVIVWHSVDLRTA